jgi:hypothetical protein
VRRRYQCFIGVRMTLNWSIVKVRDQTLGCPSWRPDPSPVSVVFQSFVSDVYNALVCITASVLIAPVTSETTYAPDDGTGLCP